MFSRRSLMQGLAAAAAMASWPWKPSKAEVAAVEPVEVDIYGRDLPLETCTCLQQRDLPVAGDVGPDRPVGPPGPAGHRGPAGPASPEAAIFSQLTGWITSEDEAMLQRDYGVTLEPAIRCILPAATQFVTAEGRRMLLRTMTVVPIGPTVEATVAALREATLQGITAAGVRTSDGCVTYPTAFHGYDVGRLPEDSILLVWYEHNGGPTFNKKAQKAAPWLALCPCRLRALLQYLSRQTITRP